MMISNSTRGALHRAYDRATTILCVRKHGSVVMIGDGQVSRGSTIVKPNAKKVRVLDDGKVLAGFAGATADALTLLDRLQNQLQEYPGQLLRASVEMAKDWRTDKYLRKLEALLIVANKDISLTLTGEGDVIEPHDGLIGIGSGGDYAIAAARALVEIDGLSAMEVAKRSMKIAADLCVYTNDRFVIEEIPSSA